MIGVNVPIPVPMAYYSFGGWKRSLFGDTHAHGAEGVHFFTRGKVVTTPLARPRSRVQGGLELGFPTERLTLPTAQDPDRRSRPTSWTASTSSTPGRRRPLITRWSIAGGRGLVRSGTTTGNRYLDFSSQLVYTNIGHQHPKVVAAIQEQAAQLCTVAPQHANDARSEAARLIAELAPGDLDKVFFTNGGAEANENAMRMARLHTGRHKVLSTLPLLPRRHRTPRSTSPATRAAGRTSRRRAGVVHFFGPYLYRSAFHATTEAEECERALAPPRRRSSRSRAPATIAAIMLETIVGTDGILVPPPGYLAGVRELCDRARHRADRRRGDGRLRPRRRVVRGRPLGRRARPDHLRQGRQLRLRPARRRRHQRRDRRDVRRPRLPRRPDLLRPPAGLRRRRRHHRHDARTRASSRTPRASAREVFGPGLRRDRRAAPVRRRGARARGVLGDRAGRATAATREPLAPYGGASPRRWTPSPPRARQRGPVAVRQLQPDPRGAAADHHRRRGRRGLAILDEALTVAR